MLITKHNAISKSVKLCVLSCKIVLLSLIFKADLKPKGLNVLQTQ